MRLAPDHPLAARATSAAKKPRKVEPRAELVLEPWPSAALQVAQDAALELGARLVKLVLPYPPALNTLYGHRVMTVNGRPMAVPYKTHEHRKYFDGLGAHIGAVVPFVDVPLVVTLALFRPRRIGDIDGPIKTLFDALNGRVWTDDSQVVELHIVRRDDKHNPRVEVSITTAAPTQE